MTYFFVAQKLTQIRKSSENLRPRGTFGYAVSTFGYAVSTFGYAIRTGTGFGHGLFIRLLRPKCHDLEMQK
jgi:hypothetical protein